jgi:hypothetical protein
MKGAKGKTTVSHIDLPSISCVSMCTPRSARMDRASRTLLAFPVTKHTVDNVMGANGEQTKQAPRKCAHLEIVFLKNSKHNRNTQHNKPQQTTTVDSRVQVMVGQPVVCRHR